MHANEDEIGIKRPDISHLARLIAIRTNQRIELVEAALWKWLQSVCCVAYVEAHLEIMLADGFLSQVYRAELARLKAQHNLLEPDDPDTPETDTPW